MKKHLKSLIVVVMLIAAMAAMYFVPALAHPGDANDPLVTRRFVEGRIAELNAEIAQLRAIVDNIVPGTTGHLSSNNIITGAERDVLFSDLIQYFESIYGEFLDAALVATGPVLPGVPGGEVIPFTPVQVPAGSRLYAEAGAEFILRSGRATAISGADGMVNVTTGVDIINGNNIPTNHLLLVPRSDGRGFRADTDVWVMIKGGFNIVN